MTNDFESPESRRFALRHLPWLIGATALIFFLFTLNRWISPLNVIHVADLTGQSFQPPVLNPAFYLATLPLRVLPTAWVPAALNVFSALCGALVLVQLARAVALLPRDRTHDQREREPSQWAVLTNAWDWLPPLLAAIACGLQLTFWEHATNGSSEMLDLLLFAFVVRALMEYRAAMQERWLIRSAIVYGVGITSNFAMIACFPLYLAALIWLRGISFFNTRFLGRMTLCGGLPLLLYLVLPLMIVLTAPDMGTFWQSLAANLKSQKNLILVFPRQSLLLLSLTSLVPIALFSIKWQSYFGDSSVIGQTLTNCLFHLVHAFFLFAGLWVMMDPPFSPRNMELSPPVVRMYCHFLPLYFLGALSIGYYCGYFLLVFGPRRFTRMRRGPTPILDRINPFSIGAVVVILLLTPAALYTRNFAEVRRTNGDAWQRFAALSTEGLPQSGILLSDDPWRLVIAYSWLAKLGRAKDFLPINTQLLPMSLYHDFLNRRFPRGWPKSQLERKKSGYDQVAITRLLLQEARTNQISYLHPSFGLFFESFYAEPRGMSYELHPYSTDKLLPPQLTPDQVRTNDAFWQNAAVTAFPPILAHNAAAAEVPKHTFAHTFLHKLKLRRYENRSLIALGVYYSRNLNYWGAEMQKQQQLDRAAECFEMAVNLNHNNVVADINREYNRGLRAGERAPIEIPKAIEDRFGIYRNWDDVMGVNGPFEEPSFCYAGGYEFLRGGLYRQAAASFDRVRCYSETNVPSRLWLAQFNLLARQPDTALELIREVRTLEAKFGLDPTNRTDLLSIECTARFLKGEKDAAVRLIESSISADPTNSRLLNVSLSILSQNALYTNALSTVDRLLTLDPEDFQSRVNKGYLLIQLGDIEKGIACFSEVLAVTNYASALLNRAIAYLQADKLPEAKTDYESLQRQYPTTHEIYFGLAEIALRQKDTNTAIRHYETYLTNAPPQTPETKSVESRLRELKGDKPK